MNVSNERRMELFGLGASQFVGRSCFISSVNGISIMLDCGIHNKTKDLDKIFPDFSKLGTDEEINAKIKCVLISHLHIDHIGALPLLTEVYNYKGPIFMTHGTWNNAIEILKSIRGKLPDGRIISYSNEMISNCLKKVKVIELGKPFMLEEGKIHIEAVPAGHVSGAVMYRVFNNGILLLYTGDYSLHHDSRPGLFQSACFEGKPVDVLLTESSTIDKTINVTNEKSQDILKSIIECLEYGGKVIVPSFQNGATQPLMNLLNTFWNERQLHDKYPLLADEFILKACNKITDERGQPLTSFNGFKPFNKSTILNAPGPMVVFAMNGNFRSGFSISLLRKWGTSSNNLILIPDSPPPNTIAHELVSGKTYIKQDETKEHIGWEVYIQAKVKTTVFNAHGDQLSFIRALKTCKPEHVVFIHGNGNTMADMRCKLWEDLGIEGNVLKLYQPLNLTFSGHTHIRESQMKAFNVLRHAKSNIMNYFKNDHQDDVMKDTQREIKALITTFQKSVPQILNDIKNQGVHSYQESLKQVNSNDLQTHDEEFSHYYELFAKQKFSNQSQQRKYSQKLKNFDELNQSKNITGRRFVVRNTQKKKPTQIQENNNNNNKLSTESNKNKNKNKMKKQYRVNMKRLMVNSNVENNDSNESSIEPPSKKRRVFGVKPDITTTTTTTKKFNKPKRAPSEKVRK